MEHLLSILQHHDDLIRRWGYLLLFGASWFEGLNSMILAGFVASLGKLNIFLVVPIIAVGHALSGFSWYAVGFFGGARSLARWGKHLRLDKERLEQAEGYFARHGGKAIFVTKFTVGLTIATLILAGTLRMNLKKFAVYNFLGSTVWACVTAFFGYTFGLSFKLLTQYIEGFTHALVFFLVFLGAAIALWYILRAVFRTSLLRAVSDGFMSLVRNRKDENSART